MTCALYPSPAAPPFISLALAIVLLRIIVITCALYPSPAAPPFISLALAVVFFQAYVTLQRTLES